MQQNALIDEALARLHDAECAIRKLQVSNVAHDITLRTSISDGNLSGSDDHHDYQDHHDLCKRQQSPPLGSRGLTTGSKMHPSTSLGSVERLDTNCVGNPANAQETRTLNPVSEHEHLETKDELPAPPDLVIGESAEMRTMPNNDPLAIRKSLIFVRLGCIKLVFFHPESHIRLFWLTCGMAFTFVDAIFIPYTLAFEVQAEGVLLRWVVDIYFLVDIVVNFFSGYLDETGILVTNPKLVWRRYVLSWFIFDVAAAFPWQLVGIQGVSRLTRNIRVIRALKLAKILRVVKLKYVMDKIEPFIEGNYLLVFGIAILRVLASLFMVCHWCSCLWFSSTGGEESGVSWISHLPDDMQGLDRVEHHRNFYLWSLYFTMTTMTTVGFGDITPTNTTEVHFCIVFLGISAIVFAGQLGILSDLISNLNTQGKVMREQKATLARYMNWRIVPKELRAAIRKHCLFLWEKNEGNDAYEDTLKDFLPPVLRLELCHHIYGGVIRSAPFLAWMAEFPTVVKFLSNVVENTFWSRGDLIFRNETINRSIQLLLSGQVRLSRNERIPHKPIHDLSLPVGDRFYVPNKNMKKRTHKHPEQQHGPHKLVRKLSKSMSSTDLNKVHPLNLPKATKSDHSASSKHSHPVDDVIEPIFQSKMIISSWRKLMVEDERQVKAANFLQCHWRKRRKDRLERGQTDCETPGKWNQRTFHHSLQTYSVKAPAFFGESCLWQERLDDSCMKPYGYNAQCESLSETLAIDIRCVQDMLNRFSPWLQDRFDRFKEGVCNHYAEDIGLIENPDTENAFAATMGNEEKEKRHRPVSQLLRSPSFSQNSPALVASEAPKSELHEAPGELPHAPPLSKPPPPPGKAPIPVPPDTPPQPLEPKPPNERPASLPNNMESGSASGSVAVGTSIGKPVSLQESPSRRSQGSVSGSRSTGASRKSLSRKASLRLITPNGPDGPKARELSELLSDIWISRGKSLKKDREEEVAENKRKALALVATGMKPCPGSLFYFSCDDDKNRTLDRAKLQEALTRIPSFSSSFIPMFEYKISELFSEGDGTIDVDEWLDLCEEIPELMKAIQDDEVCKTWKDLLEP